MATGNEAEARTAAAPSRCAGPSPEGRVRRPRSSSNALSPAVCPVHSWLLAARVTSIAPGGSVILPIRMTGTAARRTSGSLGARVDDGRKRGRCDARK